jgi:hypothetical protein
VVEGDAWDLVAEDGRARCAAASGGAASGGGSSGGAAVPELRVSRPALGTLYLGCASASQLLRAGVISGDSAAVAAADRLFASAIAPWCPEVF